MRLSTSQAAAIAAAAIAAAAGCGPIEPVRPSLEAKAKVEALCAMGPRVSGTLGAAEAASWIARELDAASLAPVVDVFSEKAGNGEETVFRNVLATLPGKSPRRILLLSHYDTKDGVSTNFVGANDGASSTALLLSLARWFSENPPNGPTLTFAFLDGEECRLEYGPHDGLHGSRRLAAILKNERVRVDAAILLDMVGDADLTLTIPANCDARLFAVAAQAAKKLGIRDRLVRKPVDMIDDHLPFQELGFAAIDLIDFEYGSAPGLNDYWHTEHDTPDKLSDATLDVIGALVIEMVGNL